MSTRQRVVLGVILGVLALAVTVLWASNRSHERAAERAPDWLAAGQPPDDLTTAALPVNMARRYPPNLCHTPWSIVNLGASDAC